MTKLDYRTGHIIGRGEESLRLILSGLLNVITLQWFEWSDQDMDGLFTQVDIPYLLKPEQLENLSTDHSRSSVDVVVRRNRKIVCFRVQGKDHQKSNKVHGKYTINPGLKYKKDEVQKRLLEKAGHLVIDFHGIEHPKLFDEIIDKDSIKAVKFFLNRYRVTEWFATNNRS